MNHPIYQHMLFEEFDLAGRVAVERDIEKIEKLLKDGANRLGSSLEEAGFHCEKDHFQLIVIRCGMAAEVIRDGLVKIDASHDDWYNDLSKKTISSIKVKNFKCPFRSGTISTEMGVYMFSYSDSGLFVFLLDSSRFDLNYEEHNLEKNTSGLVSLLTLKSDNDATIGEEVGRAMLDELQTREAYAILAALMYIAMSNSSIEEYGDAIHRKSVLNKGKKKKGIPRHTTNVINVRQKIRKGAGYQHGRGKSDKTWIVRGHWRNQWYSKLDEHKPKWIDPYFKGDGKVAADKVYKI